MLSSAHVSPTNVAVCWQPSSPPPNNLKSKDHFPHVYLIWMEPEHFKPGSWWWRFGSWLRDVLDIKKIILKWFLHLLVCGRKRKTCVGGREEISRKEEQGQGHRGAYIFSRNISERTQDKILISDRRRDGSEGWSTKVKWVSAFKKFRQLLQRNMTVKGQVLGNTKVMIFLKAGQT